MFKWVLTHNSRSLVLSSDMIENLMKFSKNCLIPWHTFETRWFQIMEPIIFSRLVASALGYIY